jgi:1-acyl-sn-glycerol-3-phosphate acyltransferase
MQYHPPSPILRFFARLVLKITGFRLENHLPDLPKYVVVAAPHTSNSDALVFLCAAFVENIRPLFTVKHTLFKPPLGWLIRWFGGYPIDRTRSTNAVDTVVDLFNDSDRMYFTITPEGTRKRTEYWKSGFYHMARRANVPLVLCYVDYKRKVVGANPEPFYPTGDIQKDMEYFAEYYAQFTPAKPENFGPIRVRPHERG